MNVFVGIRSYCSNDMLRCDQRETWIPSLQFPYKFFVGRGTLGGTSGDQSGDIVQVDCSDARDSTSHKTHHMIAYAFERGVDYFFLCDNDTYVVPARLVGFENHDYLGRVLNSHYQHKPITYIHDSAVWFSRKAMAIVLESAELLSEETHCADVLTSRALLNRVQFTNDVNYVGFRDEFPKTDPRRDNKIIVTHPCKRNGESNSPTDMQSVHAAYLKSFS